MKLFFTSLKQQNKISDFTFILYCEYCELRAPALADEMKKLVFLMENENISSNIYLIEKGFHGVLQQIPNLIIGSYIPMNDEKYKDMYTKYRRLSCK